MSRFFVSVIVVLCAAISALYAATPTKAKQQSVTSCSGPACSLPPADAYGMVIDIPSLAAIKEGFKITLNDDRIIDPELKASLTAIIGFYDSGKTFIANQLTKYQVIDHYNLVTKAFSFRLIDGAVLMDTEGSDRTVPRENLTERIITDIFIQAMAIKLSNHIILAIDTMHSRDSLMIDQLLARIRAVHGDNFQLYIVHNFKNLVRNEDVQSYIRQDITDAFGAKKAENEMAWSSDEGKIIHLVLAKEGSDAGLEYNSFTWTALKEALKVRSRSPQKLNILAKLKEVVSQMLPTYLIHPKMVNGTVPHRVDPNSATIATSGAVSRSTEILVKPAYQRIYNIFFGQKKNNVQSSTNRDSCSAFRDQDPAAFHIIFDNDTHPTILRLNDTSFPVRFFPVTDLTSVIPVLTFSPRYDIFRDDGDDKKFIVKMEVNDAFYNHTCKPTELHIFGCQSLDANLQNSTTITRLNTVDQRTYSTFSRHILLPDGVDCASKKVTEYNGTVTFNFTISSEDEL